MGNSGQNPRQQPGSADELTLKEAAAEFGVSVRTLQRFRAAGRLPGIRKGRGVQIRRDDLERAMGWKDPASLLRRLLATDDEAPLDTWMEGWKQLTRLTVADPVASEAWIAWSESAIRQNPGRSVGQYRVRHLIMAAEASTGHEHIHMMTHSMRRFDPDLVARDALRVFFTSVAPWTRA